jgi:hypothetical protein
MFLFEGREAYYFDNGSSIETIRFGKTDYNAGFNLGIDWDFNNN